MDKFSVDSTVKHPMFDKINKKIVLCILCIVIVFFFLNAPVDFPIETIFRIDQGNSLRNVSLKLKNEHIIRSRIVFEAFVIIFGREKRVISTDYYFENKLPVYEIARRISKGEHHMMPIRVTIPEGFNVSQIGDMFALQLYNFSKDKFL